MSVLRTGTTVPSCVPIHRAAIYAVVGQVTPWHQMAEAVMVCTHTLSETTDMSFFFTTFADINECTSNTDNCAQTCSNTVGGFTCGCFSGYRLNNDGRTCRGEYLIFSHLH